MTITIPERIKCLFFMHDLTKWRTTRKAIVIEKERHCRRGWCTHQEVKYI